jgi:hypothetical protein
VSASRRDALARLLYWSPRVLAGLFAAFLSVFAFAGLAEALAEGHGLRAGLIHFAVSLPPTLVILLVLGVAWRWQRVGAAAFTGLAIAYVATSWGQFPISTYVVIAGPMLLVAALFLADWKYRT